ncbi:hypothetical protein ANN_25616 [Periplaneta americana]|uniref:Uncharacterized protein n=1 Tax=Periplaneta americana TaxID=6978 RepID=A0ABQ8S1R3_PERAM|nr:hypothetical protein ANN_25616 [Periplaneta americana]
MFLIMSGEEYNALIMAATLNEGDVDLEVEEAWEQGCASLVPDKSRERGKKELKKRVEMKRILAYEDGKRKMKIRRRRDGKRNSEKKDEEVRLTRIMSKRGRKEKKEWEKDAKRRGRLIKKRTE